MLYDCAFIKCDKLIVFILNKCLGSKVPKIRSETIKGIRNILKDNKNTKNNIIEVYIYKLI